MFLRPSPSLTPLNLKLIAFDIIDHWGLAIIITFSTSIYFFGNSLGSSFEAFAACCNNEALSGNKLSSNPDIKVGTFLDRMS